MFSYRNCCCVGLIWKYFVFQTRVFVLTIVFHALKISRFINWSIECVQKIGIYQILHIFQELNTSHGIIWQPYRQWTKRGSFSLLQYSFISRKTTFFDVNKSSHFHKSRNAELTALCYHVTLLPHAYVTPNGGGGTTTKFETCILLWLSASAGRQDTKFEVSI